MAAQLRYDCWTRLGMEACLVLLLACPTRAQPQETATLNVRVTDESARPLPARVHLRDSAGRWLLLPGQPTRQRAVYRGTQPVAGDWFYTEGSFSIAVKPGEAQIDIVHGPAYTAVHDSVSVDASRTVEKTYTLRRLVGPTSMGWYSGDEHLHQVPDATLMLAEDLNVAAIPVCAEPLLRYQPQQRVTPLPDAEHLLVTQVPALEWDCFLWDVPKPWTLRLDGGDWPDRDGTTAAEQKDPKLRGGGYTLRTGFVARSPFVIEQAHAAGAITVAYMHDPPRLWYYPLYVANGWIDIYGVLENAFCGIANRSEAEFWRGYDAYFGIWYRFLNCGYRLPASAGTDNIGMGVGVWKGYNRVYVKVDGPFTLEKWVAAWKQGRSFVTNRPLLFATVDGQEPGSELAVRSAQAQPLKVDVRIVSATPVSRIDILYNGRVLRQIELDAAAPEVRRSEDVTVSRSGWLAVRCFGRGQNANLGPAFALAHTSPFYVIVDGQPIRSPDDARWLHEQFSAFLRQSLPRLQNEQIRTLLEAKCSQALAKYAEHAASGKPHGAGRSGLSPRPQGGQR